MLIPSCKAQYQEREGGEDQKLAGGTASEDGRGLVAVTSWRQPGTGIGGGGWCTSAQGRPYGHPGYGIGDGEGGVIVMRKFNVSESVSPFAHYIILFIRVRFLIG